MPFSLILQTASKYNALVSDLTSSTDKACPLMPSYKTMTPTDAVRQNHDAETPTEIGGVHNQVNGLRCDKLVFGGSFAQMTADGFTAAMKVYCKLFSRLFAF